MRQVIKQDIYSLGMVPSKDITLQIQVPLSSTNMSLTCSLTQIHGILEQILISIHMHLMNLLPIHLSPIVLSADHQNPSMSHPIIVLTHIQLAILLIMQQLIMQKCHILVPLIIIPKIVGNRLRSLESHKME